MVKIYSGIILSVLWWFGCSGLSYSQGILPPEKESLLPNPLVAPSDEGVFHRFNLLPDSIRRSPIVARELHDALRSAGSDGRIDLEAKERAVEQTKSDILRAALSPPKLSGSKLPIFSNAWSNIGPANTSGCTKAIAVDPHDRSTVYAGAAGGGVWKTTNGGDSWTALTDNVFPNLAVASIAIAPGTPSTIYVGTGDNAISIDALDGSGLYKSVDAGASWKRIGQNTFTATVNKVLVHPLDTSIVFACSYDGTSRALYRSSDGGSSFTKVYPTTGSSNGIIWDIVAAEDNGGGGKVFYMIVGNNPGGLFSECGVYQSVDDGKTWNKLDNNGLPEGYEIGKASISVPRGNTNHVYVFIATPGGELQGFYVSKNGGISFTRINSVPSSVFNVGAGAQGWYDLYLASTSGPGTTDTVYIGGIEAYRSYNGGTSWAPYSDYYSHSDVHADHQSIAIDPIRSSAVWIGTDGGVYRSGDAGQSWVYKSTNMMTMRTYRIGLDPDDYTKTYAGFQDQGIWRLKSGSEHIQLFGGDGFQTLIDPIESSRLHLEGPNGDLYSSLNGGAGYKELLFDFGDTLTAWDVPVQRAPKLKSTLFFGRTKLWRSDDEGIHWSPISPVFTSRHSALSAIGLSSSSDSIFWVGSATGKIKRTTDAGATWSDRSSGLPPIAVASIVCHPSDGNFAVASFRSTLSSQSRVSYTTNGGKSWIEASGTNANTLPGVPVNSIALDSADPSSIWYAATENGVYFTLNAGKSWEIAGTGLGLVSCQDIQLHPNRITLRVGTHGRSLWETNVSLVPVEFTTLTGTKATGGTQLQWSTDAENGVSGFDVERSVNYQPFETAAFVAAQGSPSSGASYSYFDTVKQNGRYIYRLRRVDLDGSEHLSNTVALSYGSEATLQVDQSFPNPFLAKGGTSERATIRYELPSDDIITARIYSFKGDIITTLLDHQLEAGGEQYLTWDGTDASGAPVVSGVYFYTIESASYGTRTQKLVFIAK